MKKLVIALTLIFCTIQVSFAQMDTKTKNKIKVKYFAATDSFEKKKYAETIDKINEIEALTRGVRIPTALNLKIKSLVKLRRYSQAKKELDILEGLELDDAIIRDMAGYSGTITSEYKKERDAILRKKEEKRLADIREKEKAKQDSIKREKERIRKIKEEKERIKKEKDAKILKEKDEANWEKAKLENTVLGYKEYTRNSDNTLYRAKANDKIIGIIWRTVIDADDIVNAAKEYLENNPNGKNKIRAAKFIKYANITSLEISHYSESSIFVKDQNGYRSSDKEQLLKDIGYLVNLKSLHIKTWKGLYPKKIYLNCLKNLEKITLGKNLNVTFNSIESLTSLKEYTNDAKGPDAFLKLGTLKKANVFVNDSQLVNLIKNNRNLKDLTIKLDGSITIRNINSVSNLNQLEKLTFSNLNGYEFDFSESIGDLKNLKYLSLKNLKKNLPEGIGNLTNLEVLDLEKAYITSLPQSIGNLSNLEVLNLKYSKITSLPESILQLTSLRELNAYTSKYSKGTLYKNKDVKKVIKQLKKANPNLNLIVD